MSTTIKSPQLSTYFNRVIKVIWFNVADVNGTFSLDLHITPNQTDDTVVVIFNRATNAEVFKKTYKKSSNNGIINETVKILHTPGLNSPVYGLKCI